MSQLKNSVITKELLQALLRLLSRNETQLHAALKVSTKLSEIQRKYDCFKYVQIDDSRLDTTELLDPTELITIDTALDSCSSNQVGEALHSLIVTLGDDANPFFFKEIKRNLSTDVLTAMQAMNVDFDIFHLEKELRRMGKL
jgi:hypothetical protein